LARRRNHTLVANRSDFNILHGFWKGNFHREANSLAPVALEDPRFHTSHNYTLIKRFIDFRNIIKSIVDMSMGYTKAIEIKERKTEGHPLKGPLILNSKYSFLHLRDFSFQASYFASFPIY